jgi:F-type H+-transporting ATPase subunit epsilon
MPLRLDIVTVERVVFSGDVDMVIAPGIEGEMGILPRHAPLITALTYGELRVKRGNAEDSYAIGGGFVEVLPHQVTVMADTAERADEIDLGRAEASRRRAAERLRDRSQESVDYAKAEAALRRSLTRIKVAEAKKKRTTAGGGPLSSQGGGQSQYPPGTE